jgi:G3E family GTPase
MMRADFKIPLILVTGFLGAGKTTFIKRLLEKYSDGRRIGIVQNEYASANIDSAFAFWRISLIPWYLLLINVTRK